MEADKQELKVLQQALDAWQKDGMLMPDKADELRASIVPKHTDRQQIAQYFFFVALFCTLLAFGAIFINDKLLEKIKLYFAWNDLVIAGITSLLSVLWFWYVSKKRRYTTPIAYEIYMVLGGLSVVTSLVYICKQLGAYNTYTTFLLFAYIILAMLSPLFRSRSLWIGALVAFICWFCTFSTWQSTDNLFLGMNYPMRYVVLGMFILGLSLIQHKITWIAFTQRITYATGLILLFTALWGVSIFGNFNTLTGWQQVRQVHVLGYSILFAAASVISFFIGIKYKDELARDMAVLFLLINLYTRYFEYFWDALNKGLFFLILAVTFGFVGWWLERKARAARKLNTV